MNKWVKPILIGVGVTILTYVLTYKNMAGKYKGHYIIRIKENEDAIAVDQRTVERAADHLERKMANEDLKAEVKVLNDQLIDLTVSRIKYPSLMPGIITSKSELEFREMYTLNDFTKVLPKIDTILGFANPAPIIPKDTTPGDTGGLATFTDGYSPEPETTRISLFNFIIPAQAYETPGKETRFPPYIGRVLIKDTAYVDSILHRKDIIAIFPIDAKFLYGPLIKDEKNKTIPPYLELYAVRSLPGKPAPLNNNSVSKAMVHNDYKGEPAISLEFNPVAAKRWERITTENIGKPIGIIINDRVISAPNVNGPIAGGTAEISGGFTKQEVEDIVVQILAGSIPATITIVKEEVSKEKESFLTGNLTFYLAIFLVVAAISYLISRLLTNRNGAPATGIDLGNNSTA